MLFLTFSLSAQNINLFSPSLEMSVRECVPIYVLGRGPELLHGVQRVLAHSGDTAFAAARCGCATNAGDLRRGRTQRLSCSPGWGCLSRAKARVLTLHQSKRLAVLSSVLYFLDGGRVSFFFLFIFTMESAWEPIPSVKQKAMKLLSAQSLLQHCVRLVLILGGTWRELNCCYSPWSPAVVASMGQRSSVWANRSTIFV